MTNPNALSKEQVENFKAAPKPVHHWYAKVANALIDTGILVITDGHVRVSDTDPVNKVDPIDHTELIP